jgi:hypothetical protein
MHKMPCQLNADFPLAELKDELKRRQEISLELMARFMAPSSLGAAMASFTRRAARIDELIELQAWTEAALALLGLVLPQWKLRRLLCEDGIWHCSLSRLWSGPEWLADEVDARHASLPLAILSALLEALESGPAQSASAMTSVPRCRGPSADPLASPVEIMCCDNFA